MREPSLTSSGGARWSRGSLQPTRSWAPNPRRMSPSATPSWTSGPGPRPADGQRLTIEGLAAHIDLIPAEPATSTPIPSDWRPPFVDSRAIALLQYTAGSTGSPKGVRVTHASLLDNCEGLRRGLGQAPTDKLLLWLPTHQGLGLLEGLLQPLFTGIPAVLLPPRAFFERPLRWLQAISTHGATIS